MDEEVLTGKPKNYSGWYYVGEELTLEDVKRQMPDAKILISNIESNGWKRVIRLRNGQVYPLYEDDIVL